MMPFVAALLMVLLVLVLCYAVPGRIATGVWPRPWAWRKRGEVIEWLVGEIEAGRLTACEAHDEMPRRLGAEYVFASSGWINRFYDAEWKAECRRNGWEYRPLFTV